MMPTRWITASQPAIPWASDCRAITSPSTRSIAPRPCRSRSEPRRTRQRTAHPAARRAWTTVRPTKPVPPVTNTRRIGDCMALRISTRSAQDDKIEPVVVAVRPAVLLVLSLALALSSAQASAQDWSGIDEAAVDAVGSGEIPGIVVVVGRGDDIVYRRAWGMRRVVPEPVAMTEDTIFDIASLTKPLGTTLAVMSLVERGHVKLDAPLDRYLDQHVFKPLGLRDTGFNPSGRVRDRVAPTEFANGHLLVGEAHDPRARVLGGVAGHAGMFSTAWDLARICRMLVDGGALEGKRVFKSTTIATMWARSPEGNASRALGWDVSSSFSRTASPFFPPEAVGHLGFTGTSVWIDPLTRSYLILLTNRVHPSGGGATKIRELRMRVAAAAGAALFVPELGTKVAMGDSTTPAADGGDEAKPPRPASVVRSGLDVLVAQDFAPIAGYTVGLVTNQTGIDAQSRRAIDLLAASPRVKLSAIFTPEHGLTGDANTEVPHGRDAITGLPVWSLYGNTRRPTGFMLRGLDLIVFDIQDVGVRYYTYLTTLVYVMEEAARAGVPVLVLDRPNPITGRVVEGPLMDPDLASFTGPHPIPVRTGMTIGEFGRMAAIERNIPVSLTIVPLEGWERGRWFDETGLPWVNPSPNIRSLTQALLYSGIGLLESTNVSVGRGTERPFEVVGAPWLDPHRLSQDLNALRLRGVAFEPVVFTPSADMYAGMPCGGVRVVVTDRETIRPVTVGLAIARTLRSRHRDQFRPEAIQNLLVNRATMWAFLRNESLDRLVAWTEMERSSFLNRRASYLIYR